MGQDEISLGDIAWFPDHAVCEKSRLNSFLKFCGLHSYDALYGKSVHDVAWFTERLLSFLGIEFDRPYDRVLDLSRGLPWARWCVGAKMNITRSCLDRHLHVPNRDIPAVIWEGEEGKARSQTYAELSESVECCAVGLRSLGLGAGDAIAIHLPMMPETVAALLAVARIGAIAVPLFSGYGPAAIESRLSDVEAKAVITCDAFPRRGRLVPAYPAVDEAARGCPTINRVFVVRRAGEAPHLRPERDISWDCLMELGASSGQAAAQPETMDAEDPLLILYTSGTTGKPKGILHSHCGFPIKAAQDMALGTDVGPADRICWVTDIGWMMGPWLIYGATLLGATIVIHDGAPDYPNYERFWDFVSRTRTGILGLSPTLVRSMASTGIEPRIQSDLSGLRILASTGEAWNPGPWFWLFEKVGGKRIPIINYSGGTEISGGILMGNPITPVKPCSFSGPCPGIAADVLDQSGASLRNEVGELAIRQPWIGMARGFWKDPDRYLQTYWSQWPNIWRHGDWALIDEDGHWRILGRSDDTIKIAGRRVGPAEIESVLVTHPAVLEAAVISIPDPVKGNAAVAFCVPAAGVDAGSDLCHELLQLTAEKLGKPLRPEKVLFVAALPRTRNSKIMRRVIRSAYLNEDLGNISALENPEAADAIREAAIRDSRT